jgi:hypothetical protein
LLHVDMLTCPRLQKFDRASRPRRLLLRRRAGTRVDGGWKMRGQLKDRGQILKDSKRFAGKAAFLRGRKID